MKTYMKNTSKIILQIILMGNLNYNASFTELLTRGYIKK
jgi:hypothetical protein